MASVQDLSSKYSSQLRQLQAIFPSWDEGDLAFTLQDTRGNVDEAAMLISEGELACLELSKCGNAQGCSPRFHTSILWILTHLTRSSKPIHPSDKEEASLQAIFQGQRQALEP